MGSIKSLRVKVKNQVDMPDILLSIVDISIDDFGELNEGQRKAIKMKVDTKIKD